jgi:hypothetical protein
MKKKIYFTLAENINFKLDDYYYNGKYGEEMLSENGSLKIDLYKAPLAFALISNEFEEPDYDDEIKLHGNKIVLSRIFVKYLMAAIGDYGSYRQAKPFIENALFIR